MPLNVQKKYQNNYLFIYSRITFSTFSDPCTPPFPSLTQTGNWSPANKGT